MFPFVGNIIKREPHHHHHHFYYDHNKIVISGNDDHVHIGKRYRAPAPEEDANNLSSVDVNVQLCNCEWQIYQLP